jgi:hypothetical protein
MLLPLADADSAPDPRLRARSRIGIRESGVAIQEFMD